MSTTLVVEFESIIRCFCVLSNIAWVASLDSLISYDTNLLVEGKRKEVYTLPRELEKSSGNLSIRAMISVEDVLWCGCEEGTIVLWSVESKHEIARFKAHSPHVVKHMLVVHTPRSETVWTVSPLERCIHVWATTAPYQKIATVQTEHPINCFAQHLRDFVWVGGNGEIHLYNSSTFELRGTWMAHNSSVNCVLSLGNRVWTGSAAGDLIVWEDYVRIR